MSTKAWGIIQTARALSLDEIIDLAFDLTICGATNRIGIKFGGNIWPPILEPYRDSKDKVVFELVDDPLDINAQALFGGEGIEMWVLDNRVDSSESLASRMQRVHRLAEFVLQTKDVIGLELHVDGDTSEETHIETGVGDFESQAAKIYQDNKGWTPTVTFSFVK